MKNPTLSLAVKESYAIGRAAKGSVKGLPCEVEGCGKPIHGRGLCKFHWQRRSRSGDALVLLKVVHLCSIEGCARPSHDRHGYGQDICLMHYKRWRKWGDPNIRRPTNSPSIRFWRDVDKDGPLPMRRPELGPCWLWGKHRDRAGYGRFAVAHDESMLAHRFAYIDSGRTIPEGFTVDHLCFIPACVRPDHLEAVTNAENVRRAHAAALPETNVKRSASVKAARARIKETHASVIVPVGNS